MNVERRARSPAVVSDGVIDQLVEELNRLHRSATFDLALTIGKLIVDRFYAGDLSTWRKRSGKDASFRKLSARAGHDLRAAASTLYRGVALYELTQRLGVSTWEHLSVSHLRAVLGLPEGDQRALLATADAGQWSTNQLEAEARRIRGAQLGKRGRPRLPGFVKTVRRLVVLLDHRDAVRVDLDELGDLADAERQRLVDALADVQETIARLQHQLRSGTCGA